MTRLGARILVVMLGSLSLGACSAAGPAVTLTPSPPPAAPSGSAPPAVPATSVPAASPTVEAPGLSADPAAPASGVTVKLTVKNTHFAPTEITAPAGKLWKLEIDDQDPADQHNFTLSSGARVVFQTPQWGLGMHDFDIGGLPAGSYLFICTFHTGKMRGSLEIP